MERAQIPRPAASRTDQAAASLLHKLLLRLGEWKRGFAAEEVATARERERAREEARRVNAAQRVARQQALHAQRAQEAERRQRLEAAAGLAPSLETSQLWEVMRDLIEGVERTDARGRAEAKARARAERAKTRAAVDTEAEAHRTIEHVLDALVVRVVYELHAGADPRAAGVDAE